MEGFFLNWGGPSERGRTTKRTSTKGSEKVLGRVLGKGFQKGALCAVLLHKGF